MKLLMSLYCHKCYYMAYLSDGVYSIFMVSADVQCVTLD